MRQGNSISNIISISAEDCHSNSWSIAFKKKISLDNFMYNHKIWKQQKKLEPV